MLELLNLKVLLEDQQTILFPLFVLKGGAGVSVVCDRKCFGRCVINVKFQ